MCQSTRQRVAAVGMRGVQGSDTGSLSSMCIGDRIKVVISFYFIVSGRAYELRFLPSRHAYWRSGPTVVQNVRGSNCPWA